MRLNISLIIFLVLTVNSYEGKAAVIFDAFSEGRDHFASSGSKSSSKREDEYLCHALSEDISLMGLSLANHPVKKTFSDDLDAFDSRKKRMLVSSGASLSSHRKYIGYHALKRKKARIEAALKLRKKFNPNPREERSHIFKLKDNLRKLKNLVEFHAHMRSFDRSLRKIPSFNSSLDDFLHLQKKPDEFASEIKKACDIWEESQPRQKTTLKTVDSSSLCAEVATNKKDVVKFLDTIERYSNSSHPKTYERGFPKLQSMEMPSFVKNHLKNITALEDCIHRYQTQHHSSFTKRCGKKAKAVNKIKLEKVYRTGDKEIPTTDSIMLNFSLASKNFTSSPYLDGGSLGDLKRVVKNDAERENIVGSYLLDQSCPEGKKIDFIQLDCGSDLSGFTDPVAQKKLRNLRKLRRRKLLALKLIDHLERVPKSDPCASFKNAVFATQKKNRSSFNFDKGKRCFKNLHANFTQKPLVSTKDLAFVLWGLQDLQKDLISDKSTDYNLQKKLEQLDMQVLNLESSDAFKAHDDKMTKLSAVYRMECAQSLLDYTQNCTLDENFLRESHADKIFAFHGKDKGHSFKELCKEPSLAPITCDLRKRHKEQDRVHRDKHKDRGFWTNIMLGGLLGLSGIAQEYGSHFNAEASMAQMEAQYMMRINSSSIGF